MSNLSLNLNLKALKFVSIRDVQGKTATKQCIVIPIEDNDMYVGEKGIYLSLIAWESDKLKDGKTHLVKQSLSKERREKMTQDEINAMPLLGDVKPFEKEKHTLKSDGALPTEKDEFDDLPF